MKTAKIETAHGTITLELFDGEAPNTVKNFETLAGKGYYNGLTFHRVIPGFMIQGGCPEGTGAGGPGYTIDCEVENNPHRHLRGTLSMAKTAAPNSGGSQFFICHEPQPHLDRKHTVFGQVVDGIEVVDKVRQGDKMTTVTVS